MPNRIRNWWQTCLLTADEAALRVRAAVAKSDHPARSSKSLILNDLEPRVLFSATPIDPAMIPGADELSATVVEVEPAEDSGQDQQLAASSATEQSSSEIIVIDSSLPDLQQFLDDLHQSDRDRDVFVLDANRDGVDQITEILSGRNGVESLHLVSHGSDGGIQLGNTWLTDDNLNAYAGQISMWQGSLSSESDILIYGCDLASGADGQHLIESLSVLTGADVAASVDDTGHQSLGGDWDLEYTVGQI
ncbi:MAG: DUF4347 domain-containing protein, partial [Pirellulaceae bacterium]|nr:DUF4347 domain-containing protein [Pirellulaceae bacterium]